MVVSHTWQQIYSLILGVKWRTGHRVITECPISWKITKVAEVIFVEDTNLWTGLDRYGNILSIIDKGNQLVE